MIIVKAHIKISEKIGILGTEQPKQVDVKYSLTDLPIDHPENGERRRWTLQRFPQREIKGQ